MDYSPIINQVVSTIWFLIPIGIIVVIFNSSWFKGVIGELVVNLSAKLMLNKHTYHLIKNVTLPTEDGSTQIDHIIVSIYGIFVVETKNMKGWIFGNSAQPMWTQKIYKYSGKFQNPLHQNYKHVKTLESLLGINEQQIHSVVVFVGNSTFKTKMPENVTYGGGYIKFIKSKTEPVISTSKVNEITSKIETGRLAPSYKTNRDHVKHVKNIVTEKENIKSQACPKCGSSMLIRETRKGKNIGKKFWGCSKFPQCKGIVNIEHNYS